MTKTIDIDLVKGMTLEQTFLKMLNDKETRTEAIEMMRSSAFSEKTKEKYRTIYVKWKSTHEEKKK